MKRILIFQLLLALGNVVLYAQPLRDGGDKAYSVPFASSNNRIEITLVNGEDKEFNNIDLRISSAPSGVKFDVKEKTIEVLRAGEEVTFVFAFDVDGNMKVNTESLVQFEIIEGHMVMAVRDYWLSIEAPESLILHPNYPNPFNPTTTIGYDLPLGGNSLLVVYDIVGREVSRLVEAYQDAGHHEVSWEAGDMASGVYIYVLTVEEVDGHSRTARRKMMLVK